jgi:hypothetical protein
MKTLTARDLLYTIRTLPELDLDKEVCVRVQNDDGQTMVGGLTSLAIDAGCTETPVLMLDGTTDAESVEGELATPEPRAKAAFPDLEAYVAQIARHAKSTLPSGEVGFAVLVFTFGDGGGMAYASNAQRPDMVNAMKEFINRSENAAVHARQLEEVEPFVMPVPFWQARDRGVQITLARTLLRRLVADLSYFTSLADGLGVWTLQAIRGATGQELADGCEFVESLRKDEASLRARLSLAEMHLRELERATGIDIDNEDLDD